MKEKLAAAAFAESEAIRIKEENEVDEENSGCDLKDTNGLQSSDVGSVSSPDRKSSLNIDLNLIQNSNIECDTSQKFKKHLSVDSGNDASSEDSNDSKGLRFIHFVY